jgi:hypothetical protein
MAASAFVLAQEPARAEPAPPPFNLNDVMPKPMISSPPVTGVRLGRLTITFEKMPLSQLLARAGVGEIAHRGDASESTYWVCYTIPGPSTQRIWLLAGELDGAEHYVSGIQAAILPNGALANESCPSLPIHLRPVSLRPGIWLGSSEASLSKNIGKSSVSERGALTYSYTGKVPGSYEGKKVLFDRTSFLHVTVRDGRVQGIVASQTTTY